MLKIQRVPTVVSLQQLGDSSQNLQEVSKRELLNAQGLAKAQLPLFRCPVNKSGLVRRPRTSLDEADRVVPKLSDSSSENDSSEGGDGRAGGGPDWGFDDEQLLTRSVFDNICLSEWEDRSEKGLFRYDVTACCTRVIPGKLGFVAQLNEGRASKKRPTEFRVDQVCQEFDESKFNFKKASQIEALFQFAASSGELDASYAESAPVPADASMVLINVSPIEYGHILLVPKILESLPQRITADTLFLATEMCAVASNSYFRVGYNSLGAYATINHLHFQAYYLMAPFPVELVSTVPVNDHSKRKRHGTKVSRVVGYPVRGFVFDAEAGRADLSATVAKACITLQEMNVPFNLLIVDGGNRVFLFPQCFAEKQAKNEVPDHILETQVNPAAFEICGHLVLKRLVDYEDFTEDFACELLGQVSLSKQRFNELSETLFGSD